MDHPINENFTSVWGDMSLLSHIIGIRLVQGLTLTQFDLDLVDVLPVLGAHEEALRVVTQIADYESMSLMILNCVSDDLSLT